MRTRPLVALGASALALVAFAACGGDDDGPEPSGPADLTVLALDTLKFDADTYSVPAAPPGEELAIAYENDGSLVHTLLVEEKSGFKLQVSGPGDTDQGVTTLEPGTYVLFCDVSGHRVAGMEATLTVE